MQTSLFDARAARDAGIAKTASKNDTWIERALAKLADMKDAHYLTVTGEGMRFWMLSRGLDEPTSPHAWGALTRIAMKRGIIRDTGRVIQMHGEKSHARRTPLWELV
jgi:hypothetical protein